MVFRNLPRTNKYDDGQRNGTRSSPPARERRSSRGRRSREATPEKHQRKSSTPERRQIVEKSSTVRSSTPEKRSSATTKLSGSSTPEIRSSKPKKPPISPTCEGKRNEIRQDNNGSNYEMAEVLFYSYILIHFFNLVDFMRKLYVYC